MKLIGKNFHSEKLLKVTSCRFPVRMEAATERCFVRNALRKSCSIKVPVEIVIKIFKQKFLV